MIFEEKIKEIIQNYNLGNFLKAENLVKRLLTRNSKDHQLCNIYGLILLKLHKTEGAISYFQRSIHIKSNFFEAHFNLLKLLYDLKKYDEAILQSKKCLKINSKSTDTLLLLGNLYSKLNQDNKSEKYFREILKINSEDSNAYYSLANLFKKKVDYEKAIDNYKFAIKFNKNYFAAYNNLGALYQEIGKFDLAILNFKSVIKINPSFSGAYQNYLFCLNFSRYFDLNLYLKLAQEFKQSLPKIDLDKIRQFPKIIKTDKKIRIGFVSGDYGNHPVSYYLLNTINHISDEKFKLIAYSNSNRMDETTIELKKRFNVWRKINHLNDTEVINLVKKDSVDILFDLSGHTAKNRLSIFVNKPAPVQVTWCGYNASTGLKEIDYIIGDPYVVPLSDQKYFTEKIFQLPNTFQCISINDDIKIDQSRYQDKKNVTFGSFNNLSKINDNVIDIWSEILKRVENSKLFLKAKQLDNLKIVENIRKKFQKNGISTEKIITEGRSKTREEMLKKYNQIDIALDPFPYSGITTSLEANWMGVPLLTKKGNNFYSRTGVSINKNLGMDDWIANNDKDYISKAISKASDLKKLFQIKKELRNKFLKSPLSNAKQYAKHFENCLNLIWKTYLEKK
ncbi:MAG: tetratricopeptide repeat protein [Pelagibacteraceae bacterium]|nr:tetratricopeptide repeat protein [Pelagibacteraceae bacterium]